MKMVDIPDDNGTGRKFRLLMADDGDFHLSILKEDERVTRKSVRICNGSGNPRHRKLYYKLSEVFKEAERLGYTSEF